MGIASINVTAIRASSTLARIAPYYGAANVNSTKDENLIKSLQYRGNRSTRNFNFAIDAQGTSTSMFYAYPKIFGTAEFLDVQSQFVGGWDGANPPNLGPLEVPVTLDGEVIVFYLYKTDHTNLGAAAVNEWSVL
jgi:hypothetical protein